MDRKNLIKKVLAMALTVVMAVTVIPLGAGITQDAQAAGSKTQAKYWLKINRQRGVVTVYKLKGKQWKPVRAMLTSVGTGTRTPLGTYKLKEKYRWKLLMLDSKGQYCSRITGGILFHSVCYNQFTKSSQQWQEFNKLGHKASHGCCRLSCIDAKWVYDNVKSGSRVTIYDSSKAGPLGKPKALKSYSGWDPTDPTKGNPNFKLKKAIIKVSKHKKKTVKYGAKYKLKSKVWAYNPNANENLNSQLKVIVKKRVNGKWVKAKFNTKKPGVYRVTYKIDYKYCRGCKKTITIKVKKAPQKKTSPAKTQTGTRTGTGQSGSGSGTQTQTQTGSAGGTAAGTDSGTDAGTGTGE